MVLNIRNNCIIRAKQIFNIYKVLTVTLFYCNFKNCLYTKLLSHRPLQRIISRAHFIFAFCTDPISDVQR